MDISRSDLERIEENNEYDLRANTHTSTTVFCTHELITNQASIPRADHQTFFCTLIPWKNELPIIICSI